MPQKPTNQSIQANTTKDFWCCPLSNATSAKYVGNTQYNMDLIKYENLFLDEGQQPPSQPEV